jgi:hypothetical protein
MPATENLFGLSVIHLNNGSRLCVVRRINITVMFQTVIVLG